MCTYTYSFWESALNNLILEARNPSQLMPPKGLRNGLALLGILHDVAKDHVLDLLQDPASFCVRLRGSMTMA